MNASGFLLKFIETGETRKFPRQSFATDFQRTILKAGDIAIGPRGECRITGQAAASKTAHNGAPSPFEYKVTYKEDGLAATVSEIQLLPVSVSKKDSLPARIVEGRTDPYALFEARQRLVGALARMNRQVGGLRSLLAGRLDLHPHQAFVAGTVILDPIRRYILADEVGLGKTIEAGVVIHDLLSRKTNARVLVLTPGPPSRQWLCEMHRCFGGQHFRLADLHPLENIDLERWTKLICSTDYALDGLDSELLDVAWDMVVVDGARMTTSPEMVAVLREFDERLPEPYRFECGTSGPSVEPSHPLAFELE